MREDAVLDRTVWVRSVSVAGVGRAECLGVVSSGAKAPRMGLNLPVSRAHFCCNSSSVKAALSLQNSSFSCSKTFIKRVRFEAAAMFGRG